MKLCAKCGTQLADNAVFCQKCGVNISVENVFNRNPNQYQVESQNALHPDPVQRHYAVDVTGKSLNQIINMLCNNRVTKSFVFLVITGVLMILGIFFQLLLLMGLVVGMFVWLAWPGKARKSIKRLIQTNSLYCVNDILNGYTKTDPLTNLAFTETYLYYKNNEKTAIIRYEDIVWVYKKVTKHSTNHISTGITEDVVIHTVDRNNYEILTKNQNRFGKKNPLYNSDTDKDLITLMYMYNPNILLGHSTENMNEYNKRTIK